VGRGAGGGAGGKDGRRVTTPAETPREDLRNELREKYGQYRSLYNAESILLIVEEHEAMERLLLSVKKILEGESATP
jgi:hypothetical protein